MPRLIFAIFVLLLALVQTTLLPLGRIIGVTPDLVLVAVLLWSAIREPREGLVWAFGIGLFLDLLTLSRLGSSALVLLPVVTIGWLARTRYFQSGLLSPLLLTLVATLAHSLALFLLSPLTGGNVSLIAVARLGVLGALLNALVAPPLYLIVQLVDRWIGRDESYARA